MAEKKTGLRSRFVQRDLGIYLMAMLDVVLAFALLVMINLAVGRGGCSWNKRADWTSFGKKKRFALSPKTKRFLKDLNKPVHIIVFVAPPGGGADFQHEDIKELLTRIKARTKYVSVEHVNVDTEVKRAQELIKKHKLTVGADAFAVGRFGQFMGGVVVFVSDKRKKLVNYRDTVKMKERGPRDRGMKDEIEYFKGEEAFLNAMIGVTQQKPPRICFSSGHGESSASKYGLLDLTFAVDALKRQNFVAETLKKVSGQIPARCNILVVAAPGLPLQAGEVSSIENFLGKGGKLVLLPRTLDPRGRNWAKTGLEELIGRWGIRIEDAVAIDGEKGIQPRLRSLDAAPISWIGANWSSKHVIGKAMGPKRPVIVDSPRALTTTPRGGKKVEAILSTGNTASWGERDLYGRIGFDAKKDIAPPVAVAAAAWETKPNGGRIVVLGSAHSFANYKLDPRAGIRDSTEDFLLNVFNWLAKQESLVALASRKAERLKLTLSKKRVRRIGWMVIMGFPLVALCLGLIVWLTPMVGAQRARVVESREDKPEGGDA